MHFSLTIFGASLPQPVLLSVMNADVSKRGKQPLSLSLSSAEVVLNVLDFCWVK